MKSYNPMKQAGRVVAILAGVVFAGSVAHGAATTAPTNKVLFKPEELEQILAPIALYPDSLLTQMLMASTYPLEVVQADRWVKANKDLKGDALTKALEAQSWDASVKSLVNFPPVLAMMSEKLDLTVKLGDAFIGQQKDVMATIQRLRAKAQANGNLKTTPEQTVIVETQAAAPPVIVIQAANPQVVYIPTYPPTVYYATWPYPAYPPAPYYPPGYVAGKAVAFGAGVAVGAAWGYAWGHSDWHGGDVNINVNQNTNINSNINRSNYQASNTSIKNGQGSFQHDPSHRQGVAYRDNATASQYGRTTPGDTAKARESARGRDAGGAGGVGGAGGAGGAGNAGGAGRAGGAGGAGNAGGAGGASGVGGAGKPGGAGGAGSAGGDRSPSGGQSAFGGVNSGGSAARTDSARGSSSRSSSSKSASPSRSSGGGGGGRSGGGGGRR